MAPTATTVINNNATTKNSAIINNHDLPYKQHSVGRHGKEAAKQIIFNMMKERVSKIDLDTCRVGEGNAFIVSDLGEVYRQHMGWKTHLGRVKPHYGR